MQLAHIVFFTLKDSSEEACQRLVDACRNYLDGHDGTDFFGVGTRVQDLSREVNDAGYHVGLHVVFQDRAAHDAYQVHERHVQFIEENKDNWEQVRVFDSYI